MSTWYVAVNGEQQGPWGEEDVLAKIQGGELDGGAHIFREGMDNWAPIDT